jgi:hypothetical protein
LKAPAFRLKVAASLPMVQALAVESPPKVEASLPMAEVFLPMVQASRLRALLPEQQEQAKVSQPTELALVPLAESRPTAPVLTVLAQASQPMVPVQAPPVQASRQMVSVQAPPELEPLPVSSRPLPQQAAAEGCRSSSAGRR